MLLAGSVKGLYLIELLDCSLGKTLIAASLSLPFLGFCFLRLLRVKGATDPDRALAVLALFFSLLPLICLSYAFISAQFGPLPGHVYAKDTKKVSNGMTRAQVVERIGQPHGWTSDTKEHEAQLWYAVQPPWWGYSGQRFYVNLIDGKVVHYGSNDNGFFSPDLFSILESIRRSQSSGTGRSGTN
jgi:hypothetical protein